MMGLVAASIMLAAAAAVCIANVHDGDIIRLCDGERIRIVNIDAPEMPGSPKCQRGRNGWCDYRLASQTQGVHQVESHRLASVMVGSWFSKTA